MTGMTQALALRVVKQLESIAGEPPGSGRLAEAHALLRFLDADHVHHPAVRGAMGKVRESIEVLASKGRWQRYGPDRASSIAHQAVRSLRLAIETRWPDDGSRSSAS